MKKIDRFLLLLILGFCLVSTFATGQQVADTLYSPVISNPAYSKAQGSIVLIDEAHYNFHTIDGRFKAFARVLEKDGYVMKASTELFTKEQLGKGKILVISNALHISNTTQWSLPTPSAFTDDEIEAVNTWVKNGGSLFLIADHMPFPGAAEKLAASFGFKFYNGFAMKNGGSDIFTYGNGLMASILIEGRNEKEKITSLQTFTGQAFEVPNDAIPVIVLSAKYEVDAPDGLGV